MKAEMIIMVRVGAPEPERNWVEDAAFSVGQIRYKLMFAPSLINENNFNAVIEVEINGIVVRRAKVGVIAAIFQGLAFDFLMVGRLSLTEWFLSTKGHYIAGGEDWFSLCTALGEWFYITEMGSLSATLFEREQRRRLIALEPAITPTMLDSVTGKLTLDDISEDVTLDDIWNKWGDDNEPEHGQVK